MNSQVKDVGMVAVAVAMIIVAVMGFMRVDKFVDLANRKLQNTAVDECSRNSRYISDNGVGIRIEEPIKDAFEACMTEKGYR